MSELFRQLYGEHIDRWNLYLPMCHYLPYLIEQTCNGTTWRGVKTTKKPMDAWVYQEIIHETKPDIVVEIGNQYGGSALMLRDFGPEVIGVDIDHSQLDPRVKERTAIRWIEGDAADPETLRKVKSYVLPESRVMVIDDSAHTEDHTAKVLRLYAPLVTPGCYFIVEDTDSNNLLKFMDRRPANPLAAVLKFIEENHDFEIDRSREKFWITGNPQGYLKRVK